MARSGFSEFETALSAVVTSGGSRSQMTNISMETNHSRCLLYGTGFDLILLASFRDGITLLVKSERNNAWKLSSNLVQILPMLGELYVAERIIQICMEAGMQDVGMLVLWV